MTDLAVYDRVTKSIKGDGIMMVKRSSQDYNAMMEHLDCCNDAQSGVELFNRVNGTNYSPTQVAFQYAVRNIRLEILKDENQNAGYL